MASVLLFLVAVLGIGLGAYAWQLDRNPAVEIQGQDPVSPGDTPLFDAGATLFAREGDLADEDSATRWGCVHVTTEGTHALDDPGDLDLSGTRVHDGIALVPALTVGRTSSTDSIRCDDLPPGVGVWSLPTNAGYPRIPLSLVIGGVAAAGLSALVHPRTRGLSRFR